jgi:hypothetical protein
MHSNAQLREWYKAADLNGNGTTTINEFFTWRCAGASDRARRRVITSRDGRC